MRVRAVKIMGRGGKGVLVRIEKRRNFRMSPENAKGRMKYPTICIYLFIQMRK